MHNGAIVAGNQSSNQLLSVTPDERDKMDCNEIISALVQSVGGKTPIPIVTDLQPIINTGTGVNAKGKPFLNNFHPEDIVLKVIQGIPEWAHFYVYSRADINDATPDQKKFYALYKSSFLKNEHLDIGSYTNYGFILFLISFLNMKNTEILHSWNYNFASSSSAARSHIPTPEII